jgi:adenylate cyclase
LARSHGHPILPKMHRTAYSLGLGLRPTEQTDWQPLVRSGPEPSGPVWSPRRDLSAASFAIDERTRDVDISNFNHLHGDGVCRRASRAADRYSGPGSSLGHAGRSAYMDATSTKAFGQLQSELTALASLLHVLATSSSLADSNERTETGPAIPLFKAVLQELPQLDSIYAGFENGAWLQVRRIGELNDEQRERLRATSAASTAINLVRPAADGELPMRRIFEDRDGNEVGQIDLWKYGYDARKRPWYRETLKADRSLVSTPYLSFSIGAPVITVSAPLRGKVPGVLAADLKLDTFSDFVQAQRPGEHGIVVMFDSTGSLIAHPNFADFIINALTHPSQPQLPNIKEINSGIVAAVLRKSQGRDQYEGSIRDDQGRDYLFRVSKFTLGEQYSAGIMLLAAQEDFAKDVRRLHFTGLILATLASAAFLPVVWIFGNGMSRALKRITAEAVKLQKLAEPGPSSIPSRIRELHELGSAMKLAQRAIWSFARFVPKELVQRVVDNSISTELGGAREEITVLFTDVRDFTTIAESADPDILMHQTSRYFSVLTEAFLAEGGTIDKFIGDAVMVFWNAPNPQPDHVERACRKHRPLLVRQKTLAHVGTMKRLR